MTDLRLMGTTATGESVPVLVSAQGEVIVEAAPLAAQAPLKVGGTTGAPELSIEAATPDNPGAMTAEQAGKLASIDALIPNLRKIDDSYDKTEIDEKLENYYEISDTYSIDEVNTLVFSYDKPIYTGNKLYYAKEITGNTITLDGFANTAKRITVVFDTLQTSAPGNIRLRFAIYEGLSEENYQVTSSHTKDNQPAQVRQTTTCIEIPYTSAGEIMDGQIELLTNNAAGQTYISGTIAHSNPPGVTVIGGRWFPAEIGRPIEAIEIQAGQGVSWTTGQLLVITEH